MRAFWMTLAVLMIGAGLLLVLRPAPEPLVLTPTARPELVDAGVAMDEPAAPSPTVASEPADDELADDELLAAPVIDLEVGVEIAAAPEVATPADAETTDAPETPVEIATTDATDELAPATEDDTQEIDLSGITVFDPDGSGVPELKIDSQGFIVADHPDSRPVAMAPKGHGLRPDLPVAERYQMTGSGTREDPYKLRWDVLVSASETYKPRKGEKEIPQWVRQADGKHVEIGGYLLFPLMSDVSDEFLLTLNQWDGCCIGIPPTPYDAIEVKLTTSAEIDTWRINYGTVRGVLKVDPYLVSNWLVGLYLLEDGELTLGP